MFLGRHLVLKAQKIVPDSQLYFRPVIQSGALHLAAIERKSQGLYQVKISAGPQAGAPDITGIPVDLRSDQYDMALIFRIY